MIDALSSVQCGLALKLFVTLVHLWVHFMGLFQPFECYITHYISHFNTYSVSGHITTTGPMTETANAIKTPSFMQDKHNAVQHLLSAT